MKITNEMRAMIWANAYSAAIIAGYEQPDSHADHVLCEAVTHGATLPVPAPPVMGRVGHLEDGSVVCWLNSNGKALPDNTPLYATLPDAVGKAAEVVADLAQRQEHLGAAETTVLLDNMWEMYETTQPETAPKFEVGGTCLVQGYGGIEDKIPCTIIAIDAYGCLWFKDASGGVWPRNGNIITNYKPPVRELVYKVTHRDGSFHSFNYSDSDRLVGREIQQGYWTPEVGS